MPKPKLRSSSSPDAKPYLCFNDGGGLTKIGTFHHSGLPYARGSKRTFRGARRASDFCGPGRELFSPIGPLDTEGAPDGHDPLNQSKATLDTHTNGAHPSLSATADVRDHLGISQGEHRQIGGARPPQYAQLQQQKQQQQQQHQHRQQWYFCMVTHRLDHVDLYRGRVFEERLLKIPEIRIDRALSLRGTHSLDKETECVVLLLGFYYKRLVDPHAAPLAQDDRVRIVDAIVPFVYQLKSSSFGNRTIIHLESCCSLPAHLQSSEYSQHIRQVYTSTAHKSHTGSASASDLTNHRTVPEANCASVAPNSVPKPPENGLTTTGTPHETGANSAHPSAGPASKFGADHSNVNLAGKSTGQHQQQQQQSAQRGGTQDDAPICHLALFFDTVERSGISSSHLLPLPVAEVPVPIRGCRDGGAIDTMRAPTESHPPSDMMEIDGDQPAVRAATDGSTAPQDAAPQQRGNSATPAGTPQHRRMTSGGRSRDSLAEDCTKTPRFVASSSNSSTPPNTKSQELLPVITMLVHFGYDKSKAIEFYNKLSKNTRGKTRFSLIVYLLSNHAWPNYTRFEDLFGDLRFHVLRLTRDHLQLFDLSFGDDDDDDDDGTGAGDDDDGGSANCHAFSRRRSSTSSFFSVY